MIVKAIVVLSKGMVIAGLTFVKVVRLLTLITPIALKCISMYQNRLVMDYFYFFGSATDSLYLDYLK